MNLKQVFKNKNINPQDHNQKTTYIKEKIVNTINISEELDNIFNGLSHPYNTKVILKTRNKEFETYLVSRSKKNITTLDNETIPINEIIYLKRKKD